MPNVTLAIDEDTLRRARRYAKEHNLSVNAMIRLMLKQKIEKSPVNWLEECFETMDRARAKAPGRWKREDLYDV
ncbi:MAG TPA: DUF6364 family protein [Acidobacteriota bacterium]|nr:DUF6364 family protein [Acidobacteriota bacterium]